MRIVQVSKRGRCCFETATFNNSFEVEFIFKYAQGAHVSSDTIIVENIQLKTLSNCNTD